MLVYLLYTDTTYVLTRESHGSQPEATDNKREEKFLAKLVGDQCEKSYHRDGPHSFPVAHTVAIRVGSDASIVKESLGTLSLSLFLATLGQNVF